MSTILRFISLVLIVIALMLLGGDLFTSLERGGQLSARSLRQVWELVDKESFRNFYGWAQASLPGSLSFVIDGILNIWSWLVFGVLGIVLAFLFGRKPAEE